MLLVGNKKNFKKQQDTIGLPKEEMQIKKRKKYDENFDIIIIIIIIIIIFERSLSLSLSLSLLLVVVVVVVVSSRVVGVQSNAKPSSTTREL